MRVLRDVLRLSVCFGLLTFGGCAVPTPTDEVASGSGVRATDDPVATLQAILPELMEEAGVPGLSIAVIRDGAVVWDAVYGVADTGSGDAVTDDMVFEAASLSKPVLATIVLRMVSRGELDLDRPLHELLPYPRFAEDPRALQLTPRLVLSHQTGLPNWGGDPLTFEADPATGFGYSGEGYVYLQRVVETLTGQTLDQLAQREVFEPLGLTHSRFSWAEGDAPSRASGHGMTGEAVTRGRPDANAASSLHTTAGDYARFVSAWLDGTAVDQASVDAALAGEVTLDGRERGGPPAAEIDGDVAWGLGWGLQRRGSETVAWHWGDNGVFRAFVAFHLDQRTGVVYLANSQNGLGIARAVVETVVGDMTPTIEWLAYEQSSDPSWLPRRAALAAEAIGDYPGAIVQYEALHALEPDEELVRRVDWLRERVRTIDEPVTVPREVLARYAGRYGPRMLTLAEGGLRYQREGRPAFDLIPLSEDTFLLDAVVGFRIEIERDEAGTPVALVGHYVQGHSDRSPRGEASGE